MNIFIIPEEFVSTTIMNICKGWGRGEGTKKHWHGSVLLIQSGSLQSKALKKGTMLTIVYLLQKYIYLSCIFWSKFHVTVKCISVLLEWLLLPIQQAVSNMT